MSEPSDDEIRYLLTKRALVVDVLQDLFGRPVIVANQYIEALPRKIGDQNPPGTMATIDADGKITLTGGTTNAKETHESN